MDYRCPHCHQSLRFRTMPEHQEPGRAWGQPIRWYKHCTFCQAKLVQLRHPAFANDWLWMKFIMPGILMSAVAIFWWPPLIWVSVPAMAIGLVVALVYTVRERWRFKVFAPFEDTE